MGLSESKSAPLESQDEASPLHAVARKGHYEAACRILSRGTEAIDSQDASGRSPLFWATEYRQERLVELLLAHGANPAVRDKEGNLCLHRAAFGGCAAIAHMLLEAGSDPNAPNDQGDSPLHLAARERHHECLVDISRGFEQVPIPCFNGVDDAPCPSDFLYVTQNIVSESVAVSVAAAGTGRSQHCSCPPGGCSPASCPCVSRGRRPWDTRRDGRLLRQGASSSSPSEMGVLFECNVLCSCASSCSNRVVQRGTRAQLQLFRTPAKGWGVRTVQDVPRGAFLCQYFGELISSTEAAGRSLENAYYFALDGQERCLDGRFYGNIGRFLNHSCRPNLVAVQVSAGPEGPGIAFFSTRPIRAGEELGFDYGDKFWAVKAGEGCRCLCGAPACRYRQEAACPAASGAAAGDVASGPGAGAGRPPLRGFALKSKRSTPLRGPARSRRAPPPPPAPQ